MHIGKHLLHEYVLHNICLLQKLIKLVLHMNTWVCLFFYLSGSELANGQLEVPTSCQRGDSCAFRCWKGRPLCCQTTDSQSHICWSSPPT